MSNPLVDFQHYNTQSQRRLGAQTAAASHWFRGALQVCGCSGQQGATQSPPGKCIRFRMICTSSIRFWRCFYFQVKSCCFLQRDLQEAPLERALRPVFQASLAMQVGAASCSQRKNALPSEASACGRVKALDFQKTTCRACGAGKGSPCTTPRLLRRGSRWSSPSGCREQPAENSPQGPCSDLRRAEDKGRTGERPCRGSGGHPLRGSSQQGRDRRGYCSELTFWGALLKEHPVHKENTPNIGGGPPERAILKLRPS